MHAFARTLVEIHQLAQDADADEFPAEVLRRLGGWIGFDGAVLGLGDACREPLARLDITEAHVHARDPAILSDYRALSATDPVTAAFVAGLAQSLAVDCRGLYGDRRLEALESFARVHGLRHLMLFGDAPAQDGAGRWLVLYRSDDVPFSAADAERLHAAWLHVACAIGRHRCSPAWPARSPTAAGMSKSASSPVAGGASAPRRRCAAWRRSPRARTPWRDALPPA